MSCIHIFACDKTITTDYDKIDNVIADNSKYIIKDNVTCKWNELLSEQYTLAFDIEESKKNINKISTLHKISHVT